MESITIYPKNEKQKTLLKTLLEEMKIRFEVGQSSHDPTLLSEEDFISKIDQSIHQAKTGNTKELRAEDQKRFLGL